MRPVATFKSLFLNELGVQGLPLAPKWPCAGRWLLVALCTIPVGIGQAQEPGNQTSEALSSSVVSSTARPAVTTGSDALENQPSENQPSLKMDLGVVASQGTQDQQAAEPSAHAVVTSPQSGWAEDSRTPALRERVQAYWAARIKRDFASAYNFLTPAYRGVESREIYAGRFSSMMKWDRAEVAEVRYEGEGLANVFVVVDYRMTSPFDDIDRASRSRLSEKWILEEGTWSLAPAWPPLPSAPQAAREGNTSEASPAAITDPVKGDQ